MQVIASQANPAGTLIFDEVDVGIGGRVAEIVGQRTNISTMLADPFAGMAISPRIRAKQLAADAPSLLVACGLALRKFDQ